jgi:hypothetical protein
MDYDNPPGGPGMTPPRKAFYYVGSGMAILGFLLFLSTFFSFASNFGNFDNFRGRAKSNMFRALSGMVLMIAGAAIGTAAKRGGSGVNSSSRDFDGFEEGPSSIMVRCPQCRGLTSESAKFCSQCGTKLV